MRFEVLGPLAVVAEEGEVRLRPAPRRLLAGLLLDADIEIATEKLVDRMWADTPPVTARNTLHAHMSALRRHLPGIIESGPDWYRLRLDGHQLDSVLFTSLASDAASALAGGEFERARRLAQQAREMWRGDPYPELIEVDSARAEQAGLREVYVTTGSTLTEALEHLGRSSEAIVLLRQLVIEHPLNEAFRELLVRVLYRDGRPADALRAMSSARQTLAEELGVEPGPRLRELEDRILLHHPDLDESAPRGVEETLPDYRTTFVGRDADIAALGEVVERRRLVTLTGAPGIGKTRLAIEVGRMVAARFPGGAVLIRLAGAVSEADVSATIASAMGIADTVFDLVELRSLLSRRKSLMILDNCEQVLGPIRRFVGAEDRNDGLQILATSRATLGVPGEEVWRLQPLALPRNDRTIDDCPSVQLLKDRLSSSQRSTPIEASQAGDVMRLCHRTGGIPLALELAARWVPWIGVTDTVELAFDPAPNEAQPPTPHHVSLRRAIDWSVETLAPSDRDAFMAASIFMGPFSLDAFRRVALPDGSRREAAATIARLADASLLTVERGGEVRYRMLEPLRDYALQALESDATWRLEDRHADWFLARALELEGAAKGPDEAVWLAEVDQELADLRAAMRRHLDKGGHAAVARIAASLGRYWHTRYLGSEGQRWLAEALSGEIDHETRLQALAAAGWAAYTTAAYEKAEDHYEECLALARESGDALRQGEALYGLARIHLPRRIRDGRHLLEQALILFNDIGAELQAAECRLWLGLEAANARRVDSAVSYLTASIDVLERHGYRGLVSVGHRYLSVAAWHDGDEAKARRYLDLAESVARAADDRRALGGAYIQRGLVEGRWGDPAAAAQAIIQALEPIPDNHDIDYCLVSFGALPALIRTKRWEMAARLLDHLDRIYDEYGWTPLDDRLPVTPEFRSTIAQGLEESGLSVDHTAASSAALAAELIAELIDVSVRWSPGAVIG